MSRSTVDAELSINEVLRRWPAALPALNALGIDTCCGGADSVSAAADRAGVSVASLVDAIARAIAPARVGR